jgi:hypothetical protein
MQSTIMSQARRSIEAEASADRTWIGLYRAGAISAALFVALTIGSILLIDITPQPPSTGAAGTLPSGATILPYIAAHKYVYLLNMIVFVGPVVLTAIVFPALFVALRHVNTGTAAFGAVIGLASVVLCLTPLTLVFGLVPLSDQYASASGAAQRASIVTTADGLLAQINSVSVGGILFAVGVLVISLAMLKSDFPKAVAILGIVSGTVGIVCESLRPVMGAWYGIYGILMLWLLAVGWKLYRLSSSGRGDIGLAGRS